jgi:hypothetical protein
LERIGTPNRYVGVSHPKLVHLKAEFAPAI